MANEANNSATTTSTEGNVTATTTTEEFTPLTPAQQKHMDEVIRQRMGKAAADVRAENARLAAELADAKAKQVTPVTETGENKEAEYKRIADQRARDAEQARKEAVDARAEAEKAKSDAVELNKRFAITTAASKQDFVDLSDVIELTKNSIKFEDGKFIVVNEAGEMRYNLNYQPMTVEEYYAEVASKKPHLVKSATRTGTGSSQSSQSNFAKSGKYELDKIFGPKSDAGLANRLAKENPAEYKRLRTEAVATGLLRK
jgi:hypothetical protein